ncbi:hypothetical protein U0070_025210 [Myodes glareolus]|uniref:Uncharacterized protein n=1 Tax=Myodes glareolus TaxID=447135 RepID=A0AAW0JDY9_MYOGA
MQRALTPLLQDSKLQFPAMAPVTLELHLELKLYGSSGLSQYQVPSALHDFFRPSKPVPPKKHFHITKYSCQDET